MGADPELADVAAVVLVPFPAQGHVTPMLHLARALAARGVACTVAVPDFVHRRMGSCADVAAAGVGLASIPSGIFDDGGEPPGFASIAHAMEHHMPAHLERMLTRGHAACVVVDVLASWAIPVASRCGVPAVGFWPAMLASFRVVAAIPELLRRRFISDSDESSMDVRYNVWTKHGEEGVMMEDGDEEEDNDDQYRSMFSECFDTAMDDNEEEGGEEQASDDRVDDDLRRAISDARRDCGTDKERLQFDKMLEDHHKLLYPGCEDGHRKLGSILELLKWKAEVGVTDSGFEKLMIILKKLFPRNNKLPVSTYEAKKLVCPLGLDVQKIHACINDCILYRGEKYENLNKCPICGALRYKIRKDDPGDVEGEPPRKRVSAKAAGFCRAAIAAVDLPRRRRRRSPLPRRRRRGLLELLRESSSARRRRAPAASSRPPLPRAARAGRLLATSPAAAPPPPRDLLCRRVARLDR
ncbi:hypothetical protein QYE76_015746 [Lolium multiflorum]|uniref:Glycosyltransferase N-terminal domain-containing protein n=1 Tax=Lolium multiflorum TaxID=4521 RepID=A0AAD8XA49_LOLMU|nr:hypothetical protein QYE76_015746 [Lolium multiflorum]